jgi:hypothetical protein
MFNRTPSTQHPPNSASSKQPISLAQLLSISRLAQHPFSCHPHISTYTQGDHFKKLFCCGGTAAQYDSQNLVVATTLYCITPTVFIAEVRHGKKIEDSKNCQYRHLCIEDPRSTGEDPHSLITMV